MKYKAILNLLFVLLLCFNCSSNDDNITNEAQSCTKTITIPQFYILDGASYSYNTEQEVPCDFPEPTDAEQIEPQKLEDFSYNVIQFEYTQDTGNNTSRLQFEIQLNNLSDQPVEGIQRITINSDNIQFSTNYGINSCTSIDANSSCVITYDVEEPHSTGISNTFELIDVEYYLTIE
ncbi:hypothetical protein [Mesoflavibacter sp. CH_XMU1404-2]|uniref:hypothetical protein n=1 Tax=Mesoflavibacter sp. CH_XMU1404-2 TaxID=3107766 RepID=UPI0030099963